MYLNELDTYAADWLGNLFPDATLDRRSITEVSGDEITETEVHFFAGIGGWPLALRLAGWPADREVWTGSCPCQPFSVAGKGQGESDPRHLWPQLHRLIGARRPQTVFGEQVASADGRRWLDRVWSDLEDLGYFFWAVDLSAAGVGAPIIRQRLYWGATLAGTSHSRFSRGPRTGGVDRTETRDRRQLGESCESRPQGHGRHGDDWDQPRRLDTVARGSTSAAGVRCETIRCRRLATVELQRGELQQQQSMRLCGECASAIAKHLECTASDGRIARGTAADGGIVAGRCRNGGTFDVDRAIGNEFGARQDHHAGNVWEFAGAASADARGSLGESDGSGPPEFGNLRRWIRETHRTNPWSDYRLISFADGKTRRIESDTLPVAHGIPQSMGSLVARCGELGIDPVIAKRIIRLARSNRVGRLRGYGNAIVPELAAVFVRCWIDCLEEVAQ